MKPKPSKRSVIKEELVILTGDYKLAIVLNQMLYWSERIYDFDEYLLEERKKAKEMDDAEPKVEFSHGWIYKKSDELAVETMLGLSVSNMLRHLTQLVDNGWLERRRNPKNKMDKTYQYRVNVAKIQLELHNIGYFLEGYPLLIEETQDDQKFQNEIRDFQDRNSSFYNEIRDFQNRNSDFQNERAISEITSEITKQKKEYDEDDLAHAECKDKLEKTAELATPSSHDTIEAQDGPVAQVYAWERPSNSISSFYDRDQCPEPNKASFSEDQTVLQADCIDRSNQNQGNPSRQKIEETCQAIEQRMMVYKGSPYLAKGNDYKAIVELLASGIPIEFMLSGIDYTFERFADKRPRSFSYCAEVIKQLWAVELEKRKKPNVVDWGNNKPVSELRGLPAVSGGSPSRNSRSQPVKKRDERYTAFYKLFPDE